MDPVRQLILSKVPERGSLSHLSKKIGKNHAYLQQFIERGVPAHLPEQVRSDLAPLLGVDERELRGIQLKKQGSLNENAKIVAGPVSMQGTIPVYGQAVAGKDGRFILNGNKVADIIAPPKLVGVNGAYAVYTVGTSMVPRYYEGEVVYVNPRLPVRQGDFVVVQIQADHEGDPPSAFIKQFVSQDDKKLRVSQFNPKKNIDFKWKSVVSVHRIIMGGDG